MFILSRKYIIRASAFFAILQFLYSCSKDMPPPSVNISTKINGNAVEFTVEAENATQFEWDFGDGSQVSQEQNPVHVFPEFGKEYTVTLIVTGEGGVTTLTEIIPIRSMTSMEMLTGGESDTDGKRWHLCMNENACKALPDEALTVTRTLPAGFLTTLGFSNACLDEFVFKHDGDYAIIPEAQCVTGELTYCEAKSIVNSPPSPEAAESGFTLINPFTPAQGLKFSFTESRNYTLRVSDGKSSADLTFNDVMMLGFSKGGFLGFSNWITDCIITDLTENSMKVAFFTSDLPPESPEAGITNGVIILTFVPSDTGK